ncbi:MAG: response regulator transcription factor [Chloroflexi bacterium]|nr:response regulator transcription factor [Chloroflexota bacterium]
MSPIRVLVVDDHPLFRQGVLFTLSRHPEMNIVGEGENGRQAVDLAQQLHPDVLLLDITMPESSGLQAAAEVKRVSPETQIVMLTASEEGDDLMAAMKAGAQGYVVKGAGAGEIVAAIMAASRGEAYITPKMAGNLLREMTHKPGDDPLSELTDRERQVLELVARGLSNKEVGAELGLAEKTVKHYLTAVLQKLHVRSRVEAALLAQRHGLGKHPPK